MLNPDTHILRLTIGGERRHQHCAQRAATHARPRHQAFESCSAGLIDRNADPLEREDSGEANVQKRILSRGYKSLEDVEMYLAQFLVLFGPTAAGKSNLLRVL